MANFDVILSSNVKYRFRLELAPKIHISIHTSLVSSSAKIAKVPILRALRVSL